MLHDIEENDSSNQLFKPSENASFHITNEQEDTLEYSSNDSLIWTTEVLNKFDYYGCHQTNVFDVASYILKKQGEMSTMKLQKLTYYSQVWSLVWDETPLFNEKIEAWANGPVIKELYNFHKGYFSITDITLGNSDYLSDEQKDTIDKVLEFYGTKKAQWLIELTHMELPWKNSREGLDSMERGTREITPEAITEYYSSL